MNRPTGATLRDDDPPPAHPPRARFDTLFHDPRHFRGDCRLLRAAVRRGWLDDAPDADRDALVARFEQACAEWSARNPDGPKGQRVRGPWCRGLFRQVWAGIELDRAEAAPVLRAARYSIGGVFTGQTTGRPRRRMRASDFRARIDANAVRRMLLAAGHDPARVRSVVVTTDPPDAPGAWSERVAVLAEPDRVYGWRVWLLCPRCLARRVHLYPVRDGVRCRKCAGLAYAGGEQCNNG